MAKPAANPEQALAAALDEAALQGLKLERLLVSFSGGADSTALLLAASRSLRPGQRLEAIHFDHGWHAASADWAAHCVALAAALGVRCRVETFTAAAPAGASLEAFARDLRYAALSAHLDRHTVGLTAHHAEDLAETFLLMALRGSGPHGLASIAPSRPLGDGLLWRPFLGLSKAVLQAYVAAAGLEVLEDPANRSPRYDRNYLRASVLPALRRRWPGTDGSLKRAARLQQEAAAVLDELADESLVACGAEERRLPLAGLQRLSPALRRWTLRRWLVQNGAPLPGARAIDRIATELLNAAPDRIPLVDWPGAAVRRYADALWLTPKDVPALRGEWRWAPPAPLRLPGGWLSAEQAVGQGLAVAAVEGSQLRVLPRRGGEQLQLPGRHHHHSLKHLWQAARVPPWERARAPLLFIEDRLVAVPGIGVHAAYSAADAAAGWVIRWSPDDELRGPTVD